MLNEGNFFNTICYSLQIFFLYSLTILFVLLTIKWKIKTKILFISWDLLTIFLVFIFHFIVNNTNKIVSEYKKKICKEYRLPNKDVLQIICYNCILL